MCDESGLPMDEVHKQTVEIVNEMAHNLSINAIRGFAVFLVKVMKALFRRIYVNEEGIQKVPKLIRFFSVLVYRFSLQKLKSFCRKEIRNQITCKNSLKMKLGFLPNMLCDSNS